MIIPTGATDTRMTTAKRQTLADFLYYSLCAGPDQGRPLRLLAAAAQPGAGRLRPDRQAQGRRPAVDLTDRDVQVAATTRPSTARTSRRTSSPRSRPQPAECDKTGAGPVRHRHRHQRAVDRRPQRAGRGPVGGRDRRRCGAAGRRRRPTPARCVDPDTGEVDHARPGRPGAPAVRPRDRSQQAADFPAPTELAASRPADTTTFGWVAAAAPARAGAAARPAALEPAPPARAAGVPRDRRAAAGSRSRSPARRSCAGLTLAWCPPSADPGDRGAADNVQRGGGSAVHRSPRR